MTIAWNTGWILAGRIIGLGSAVLVTVLLARRLGLEGFAGYAVLAALIWIANVLTTFGTDMVLVRDLASGGPIERWRAALAVQIGLSVVAVAALWALAPLLPWPSADGPDALRVLALALLPMAATSVATAVLRGVGAMGRYAAVGLVTAVIQVAAVAAFVADGAPLLGVAWTLAGVQVVAAVLTWTVAAERVRDLRRIGSIASVGRREVTAMTRASLPIGVLGLLGMLYQRGPIVALAAMNGPVGTAYMAAALRVTEASKSGHVALFTALFPAMASPTAERGALHRSWLASLGGAVLVAAALVLLASLAIALLYGPDFAPAATALAILGLSVVPSTAGTYRTLELLAARRERAALIGLGTGLAVLAGGLAVLIPTLGWIGGAWAILGAEIAQLAALLVAGRQSRPALAPRRVAGAVAAGAAEPAVR